MALKMYSNVFNLVSPAGNLTSTPHGYMYCMCSELLKHVTCSTYKCISFIIHSFKGFFYCYWNQSKGLHQFFINPTSESRLDQQSLNSSTAATVEFTECKEHLCTSHCQRYLPLSLTGSHSHHSHT